MNVKAICVTLAAVGTCAALFAQEGVSTGSRQRTEQQKRGLPPPYYYYPRGAPTTSHTELSCSDAIRSALQHASQFTQSEIDEQIAGREVTIARAGFMPVVASPIAYYGNTPSRVHESGAPLVPSFAPSNGINKTSAFLSAGGFVDLSTQLHAALDRSRELLTAAHQGSEDAKRNLVIATVDAYYGLSLARQRRRLADETLALAEAFAQITAELVASGKSEQNDLSRARAEALRRRDELEQARIGESAASDLLHAITGIDPLVHVGVVRPTTEVPTLGALSEQPPAIIASRPQLQQIEAQANAAAADRRSARGERLPQLTYNVAVGFDATDIHDIHRFTGVGGFLGITVPIYNFGIARAHEAEAVLRQRSLENQHQVLVRTLTQEFFSTRAAALGARERIRVSQERAANAEKNLYDLLGRYRDHKSTITELLDAQSAHSDARSALYQAVTDYESARARLAIDPSAISYEPERLPPAEANALCAETTPPRIAGLSLGATVDEIRSRYPGIVISAPDERGVITVEASGSDVGAVQADDPAFQVRHVTLKFYRNRLYSVRILFSPDVVWATKDAFLTAAADRFHLPGPWRAFYDWQDRTLESDEDIRELAAECRGFRIRLGLGYFSEGVRRVATPHIRIEDTQALQELRPQ